MATVRRCEFCRDELPAGSRPSRRYCSDDCRKGRAKVPAEPGLGPVAAALEESVAKAKELGKIGAEDAAAVAAARVLARRIDQDDERWEYALAWARDEQAEGRRPRPPAADNVSLPTFLNYCNALGLTVGSRKVAPDGGKGKPSGRKLDRHLSAVPRPQR